MYAHNLSPVHVTTSYNPRPQTPCALGALVLKLQISVRCQGFVLDGARDGAHYLSGLFYVENCCDEVKSVQISAVDFPHYFYGSGLLNMLVAQLSTFALFICFPMNSIVAP